VIPIERLQKSAFGRLACRIYTLLSVMLLFTLFRADSVTQGFGMIGTMFSAQMLPEGSVLLAKLSVPAASLILCIALALALSQTGAKLHSWLTAESGKELIPDLCCLTLFVLSILSLAQSGFHPFIYFQF
jgi:alginate O-acetyltransferase complex protein AlgI